MGYGVGSQRSTFGSASISNSTLGHYQQGATDDSRRHEIDIVVTTASSGKPSHHEIARGIEGKTVAKFGITPPIGWAKPRPAFRRQNRLFRQQGEIAQRAFKSVEMVALQDR
jgi:hypothetical protein